MSDREGLYTKYIITKADGTPVNDRCFILKPDKDPAAIKALQAYAAATYNEQLRNDLYAWVGKPLDKPMQKPLTLEELKKAEAVWIEYSEEDEPKLAFVESIGDKDAYFSIRKGVYVRVFIDQLGSMLRCWASRPTDKEREVAAWES